MWKQVLCLTAIAGSACPAGAAWAAPSKSEKAQLKAVFISVPAETANKIAGDIKSRCRTIEFAQTESLAAGANPPAMPDYKARKEGR